MRASWEFETVLEALSVDLTGANSLVYVGYMKDQEYIVVGLAEKPRVTIHTPVSCL